MPKYTKGHLPQDTGFGLFCRCTSEEICIAYHYELNPFTKDTCLLIRINCTAHEERDF